MSAASPYSPATETSDMAGKQITACDRRLGKRIKECRVAAGLPRAEAAAVLGISYQQFQKYETGTNRISAVNLRILAGLFRCALADFFPPRRADAGIDAAASSEAA